MVFSCNMTITLETSLLNIQHNVKESNALLG